MNKKILAYSLSALVTLLVIGLLFPSTLKAITDCDQEALGLRTEFYDQCDEFVGVSGAEPVSESDIIKDPQFGGGRKIDPTGIVLHWTGGSPNQSVDSLVVGMKGRTDVCGEEGCSVQLYIDGSGDIYQLTETLDTYARHAAGANDCCIGIEIAGRGESDLLNNKTQQQSVAKTVAYLLEKYDIPQTTEVRKRRGVLSHHLISPGRKQDVGDEYLELILQKLSKQTTSAPSAPSDLDANRKLGKQMAAERGFTGQEWRCLHELWERESNWDERAENPSSGAYGIPQSLPPEKMASAGSDWRTNPETQIEWGLNYIEGRYDTPCRALAFHDRNNWY